MSPQNSQTKGYILVAGLGAFAGGLLVIWATKAVPKMMSQMMQGMMNNMMFQMSEQGCMPER